MLRGRRQPPGTSHNDDDNNAGAADDDDTWKDFRCAQVGEVRLHFEGILRGGCGNFELPNVIILLLRLKSF